MPAGPEQAAPASSPPGDAFAALLATLGRSPPVCAPGSLVPAPAVGGDAPPELFAPVAIDAVQAPTPDTPTLSLLAVAPGQTEAPHHGGPAVERPSTMPEMLTVPKELTAPPVPSLKASPEPQPEVQTDNPGHFRLARTSRPMAPLPMAPPPREPAVLSSPLSSEGPTCAEPPAASQLAPDIAPLEDAPDLREPTEAVDLTEVGAYLTVPAPAPELGAPPAMVSASAADTGAPVLTVAPSTVSSKPSSTDEAEGPLLPADSRPATSPPPPVRPARPPATNDEPEDAVPAAPPATPAVNPPTLRPEPTLREGVAADPLTPEPESAPTAPDAALAAPLPERLAEPANRTVPPPSAGPSFSSQLQAMIAFAGQPDRPVTARLLAQRDGDGSRMTIELDPAELGSVEVALQLDDRGTAAATFVVERAETLQLLQRDTRTLLDLLAGAGFKLDPGDVGFQLRDGQQQDARRQPGAAYVPESDRQGGPSRMSGALQPTLTSGRGLLDLRV